MSDHHDTPTPRSCTSDDFNLGVGWGLFISDLDNEEYPYLAARSRVLSLLVDTIQEAPSTPVGDMVEAIVNAWEGGGVE